MPRWLRVIRGMIGTGVTFSAGVGVIGAAIGAVAWLTGGVTGREIFVIVSRCAVIAFPVGVAFSGVLAATAGGRSFDRFSLRRFAAMGAGAGFLLFLALSANAFRVWSVADAVVNLTVLVGLGAGSATASLLVARRTRSALSAGDESRRLSSVDEG